MQAYGTGIRLDTHGTDTMPSKSAVIGMIAAAMGRRRDEDISDLRSLRFGVRADEPGTLLRDFHMAHIWDIDENGCYLNTTKAEYLTHRYYIQDGCFTVGLEGDAEFLEKCGKALEHPVFPLYLGRRACVPDIGMVRGIADGNLETVLETLPKQPRCRFINNEFTEKAVLKGRSEYMRVCVETSGPGDRMRHDNPVSFNFHKKQYSYRKEKEYFAEIES